MVVPDVEGHVAAMGDGCSEVGWQPVCGGVGMPSAEDNGAMAGCLSAGIGRTRNMHDI